MPTRAGAEPGWSWEHNPVFPHGCFSSTTLQEAKIRRPRLEPTQSSVGHWCPNSYLTTAPNASGESYLTQTFKEKSTSCQITMRNFFSKIHHVGKDTLSTCILWRTVTSELVPEEEFKVFDCYWWESARESSKCLSESQMIQEKSARHVWPLHEKGTPNGRQTWKGI